MILSKAAFGFSRINRALYDQAGSLSLSLSLRYEMKLLSDYGACFLFFSVPLLCCLLFLSLPSFLSLPKRSGIEYYDEGRQGAADGYRYNDTGSSRGVWVRAAAVC
uniref:Uncharacterized protein n=1 Tax=Rhizophora mucronata TaxID=61149 RepID=A0A2P2K948_RHIMU